MPDVIDPKPTEAGSGDKSRSVPEGSGSILVNREGIADPGSARGIFSPTLWILLGVVCQVLLFSKWYAWNGALSFGCRMLAETLPAFVALTVLSWPAVQNLRWFKALLVITAGLAFVLHLAGTVTFDMVAADKPLKSNWSFNEDFIMLYIRKYGLVKLLGRMLGYGALLSGVS